MQLIGRLQDNNIFSELGFAEDDVTKMFFYDILSKLSKICLM